jgi:hypothetical protein
VEGPVRNVTIAALVAVLALLIAQVAGIGGLDGTINGVSIALLAPAALLAHVLVAPEYAKALLDRIEYLRVPGLGEAKLRAAEQIDKRTVAAPDDPDDVKTSPRPRDGGPQEQHAAVRDKLRERLRFIRDVILDLPGDSSYEQIVEALDRKDLLLDDELEFVRNLLADPEGRIEKIAAEPRREYLDSGWRFSVRLGTLVFERLVRRKLAEDGWLLFNFEQARSHRSDFLAFKGGGWRVLAARVEPGKTDAVWERLQRQTFPFDASPTVVLPDSRPLDPDDRHPRVSVLTLEQLLEAPVPKRVFRRAQVGQGQRGLRQRRAVAVGHGGIAPTIWLEGP